MMRIDKSLGHHVLLDLAHRRLALDRIEVVQRIRPSLPLQPRRARPLGVQIVLDLHPEALREPLRVMADYQVVVGHVHDLLRNE